MRCILMPDRPSNAWDDERIRRGMTAQLALRREALQAGQRPIGWKVGFGAAAAQAHLEINGPLVGFLLEGALLDTGTQVSVADWSTPVAEPEIAVHIGRDVPGQADLDLVRQSIAGLGPAIELADLAFPPDDVEAILSGNIYQRHLVLGPPDPSRAGADLEGMVARVAVNGAEVAATADLEVATGAIVDIVQHAASVLAAFGERLRAGDVLIAGSLVPPLRVGPGDQVTFELEPLRALSVGFTD